jgi:hypothetical protein
MRQGAAVTLYIKETYFLLVDWSIVSAKFYGNKQADTAIRRRSVRLTEETIFVSTYSLVSSYRQTRPKQNLVK